MSKNEGFVRESYPDRESWLEARKNGLGASDASPLLEVSPWVSKIQLWEEKTGRRAPKDLSNVPAVQRGIREEPIIREAFIADHPEFIVEHYPFDLLRYKRNHYITATLDGELIYMGGSVSLERRGLVPGMRGVLEIKTGSYSTKRYLDQWTGDALPIHYFAQVCQQLLVTGWDFAWVQAKLFRTNSNYRGRSNAYLPETYETFFLVLRQETAVIESMQAIEDAASDFITCWREDRIPWTSIPVRLPF